ncbi:uncharacterized protein SETTUDRAFT_103000 [Exserohilum turcica Et28A]|uniref:YMC020W-like alpha/beta hydrolase domain-containing protein n=1 Tax=Exserohilum turcicum (strain 28A) TaxID=671987 RepID=R0J125_EXST2|nr:uncharacterized protein SETTUDRAFT_103000 [Exserohilum turcica Et28A]EOA90481.1 hypothetical protein SETTUDRAFT_103000 [Exserohilum turcica Et28A]
MNLRKKSKPETQAPPPAPITTDASTASTTASTTNTTPSGSRVLRNASPDKSAAGSAPSTGSTTPTTTGSQTPRGRKWLSGTGSWRSKAPPIVQTAKESIGVSGGATNELPGEEAKTPKDESPKRFLTKRSSSKSQIIPAAITQVNVSSDGLVDDAHPPKQENAEEPQTPTVEDPPEPPLPPEPSTPKASAAASTWGWKSWWSRPDGYTDAAKATSEAKANVQEASSTPLPGPTPSEEPDATTKSLDAGVVPAKTDQDGDTEMKDAPEVPPSQEEQAKEAPPSTASRLVKAASGSWFWTWSSAQNAQANPPPVEPPAQEADSQDSDQLSQAPPKPPPEAPVEMTETAKTAPLQEAAPAAEPAAPSAGDQSTTPAPRSSKPSAWAFWYRGKPDDNKKPGDAGPQKHVGEVAVFDTPSQSNPEAAQFNEQEQPKPAQDVPKEPQDTPEEKTTPKKPFASLRGRPKTKPAAKDSTETAGPSNATTPTKTSPVREPAKPEPAPVAQPTPKKAGKGKQEPPNLLLPEFRNTYHMVQQPNFWKQIRQYFLGGEPVAPHLHINPAPPKIKKAVAIGVHGFFPAPIIQKVLGQPTGTSIRFANAAAAAIKEWTEARGYCPEIEQIALEGEGFIAERVNSLWKLLLNWIDHIKQADFILVACHSQGVPVAMMLVAKLIQFGCVNATRIGVCAMAGVNMGPFIEYKTKYFGPTAAELFEFSNPKSLVSQMYLAALDEVLRFGVRILYVGSIDDQLVSVESSTFSTLSHPYIYRAVFVDGRIHAPDFLTHLVGFTLKLRNLGLPDHGLIRELSPALAGSLYGGEGHSRVYEDPAVYALAVQHALETTSLPISSSKDRPSTAGSFQGINIPIIGEKLNPDKKEDLFKLRVKEYEPSATTTSPNPFFLPWAMRGLLEEDVVKKELGQEVEKLLALFEQWKPTGKQLKDVKFRLEGVRSKL